MKKSQFNKYYNDFDYYGFQNVCLSLGESLNGRKDRFDKSDIIEAAIAEASGGCLEWVDQQGYDLYDQKNNLKYEVKSGESSLFTKKGVKKKKDTGDIKLTNTLQQGIKVIKNTADYLIIVNTKSGSLGITKYKTAIKYSTERDDGFTTKIPLSEIVIIHHDTTKVLEEQTKSFSYKERKERMQKEYVRSFINE
tara:strand:+ start:360 stop:941 length:582 start_codon:yes stop_codon:yes gene_type:complete